MRNFNDLLVWNYAHSLTLKIYHETTSFPPPETYGLISQMRRSASSIPTNIAEGCGRLSNADFKRFLIISIGSCSELEYQLLLAKDLLYIKDQSFQQLTNKVKEIRKMLYSFHRKLK